MRRVRIGNDFTVSWKVEGVGLDDITIQACGPYHVIPITEFSVSGDTITFSIPGSEQTVPGAYSLKLSKGTQVTYEEENVFELVTRTSKSNIGNITSSSSISV